MPDSWQLYKGGKKDGYFSTFCSWALSSANPATNLDAIRGISVLPRLGALLGYDMPPYLHDGSSSKGNWTLGRGWETRSYPCALSEADSANHDILRSHSLDTSVMFIGRNRIEVFRGLFSLPVTLAETLVKHFFFHFCHNSFQMHSWVGHHLQMDICSLPLRIQLLPKTDMKNNGKKKYLGSSYGM